LLGTWNVKHRDHFEPVVSEGQGFGLFGQQDAASWKKGRPPEGILTLNGDMSKPLGLGKNRPRSLQVKKNTQKKENAKKEEG